MVVYQFDQLDVFSSRVGDGNAVAVVHEADDVSVKDMQRFARWTNLAETVFLSHATGADAHYRARIFTSTGELPFAGHPTLGAARAWADAAGYAGDEIIQECGIGLVPVRRSQSFFEFAAPELRRAGPVENATREAALAVLRMPAHEVVDMQWIANGPTWIGVRARSAAAVLALDPDLTSGNGMEIGVIGAHDDSRPATFEMRAFLPGDSMPEDPVTGSLAAGFAQWLFADGLVSSSFSIRQGTMLGRRGQVEVSRGGDGQIWIGGDTRRAIHGLTTLE